LHNPKIIKYLEKIKREGSSKGTVGSLDNIYNAEDLKIKIVYLS
jgi:hypothetical protein